MSEMLERAESSVISELQFAKRCDTKEARRFLEDALGHTAPDVGA